MLQQVVHVTHVLQPLWSAHLRLITLASGAEESAVPGSMSNEIGAQVRTRRDGSRSVISLLIVLCIFFPFSVQGQSISSDPAPNYSLAFAGFAPLNSDIFIADADGSDPRALLAHPDLDYNASFSRDGKWIVFTSTRGGSADIYRAHSDGSALTRLTDDHAFDDQGTLSPDGKELAFVSTRSGHANIWVLVLATGRFRNITNHPAGDFRPSWSDNGHWIAFSSDRDSKNPRGPAGFETVHSTEIYVVRPDGSGLRRMTRAEAFAGSPTWSVDSKQLVFYQADLKEVSNITSARRLRGTTQIATIDLETNEVHVLTEGDGEKWSPRWIGQSRVAYVSGGPDGGLEFTTGSVGARGEFGSPSWSTDGRRMVFHREVDHRWPPLREWHSMDPHFRLIRSGIFPSFSPASDRLLCSDQTAGILHNSILVMNADGSHSSVLFQDPVKSALGAVWSPRGDKIAFALGRFFQSRLGPASADIVIINSDGNGLSTVTDGSGNYAFPSWSPDGRSIVYRSSTAGKSGLLIVDTESRAVRALNTGSDKDNFPTWSPLGDQIAFTSYRDGNTDIYTIKPDGTDLKRLTKSPGNDAHSTWSSDGKWIAFTSARGGFKDEAALHPYNPQPYGDLYVMRADGSDVRQLTDDQFEKATPSWAPLR